jgi:hypothetical protein
MATIRLINRAAHIKALHLGAGGVIRLPPTENDVAVDVPEAEVARVRLALATPAVQAWIAAGELVVQDAGAGSAAPAPVPATAPAPSEPPEEPAPVRSTRRSRKDDDG